MKTISRVLGVLLCAAQAWECAYCSIRLMEEMNDFNTAGNPLALLLPAAFGGLAVALVFTLSVFGKGGNVSPALLGWLLVAFGLTSYLLEALVLHGQAFETLPAQLWFFPALPILGSILAFQEDSARRNQEDRDF